MKCYICDADKNGSCTCAYCVNNVCNDHIEILPENFCRDQYQNHLSLPRNCCTICRYKLNIIKEELLKEWISWKNTVADNIKYGINNLCEQVKNASINSTKG